jgi:hypothetical protein
MRGESANVFQIHRRVTVLFSLCSEPPFEVIIHLLRPFLSTLPSRLTSMPLPVAGAAKLG